MASNEEESQHAETLQESSSEWEVTSYEGDTPIQSESEESPDESSGDEILRYRTGELATVPQSRVFTQSSRYPDTRKSYKRGRVVQPLVSNKPWNHSFQPDRRRDNSTGNLHQNLSCEQAGPSKHDDTCHCSKSTEACGDHGHD